MNALTVLYDGACPFCVRCRDWLAGSQQRIPLRLLDVHGEVAQRSYGRIAGDGRELVVIDDGGRYWVGPAAFLMCMWALERWADLAWFALLAPVRPFAVAFFKILSSERTTIATVLGMPTCAAGHCGVARGGPYRTAAIAPR